MLSTIIREYQGVDTDKDVCVDIAFGIAHRFSTALQIFPGCTFVMDKYIKIIKDMKDMDITKEELMILKVLVFFSQATAMLSTLVREYQGVDTDKDVCIDIGFGTAYRFSTALKIFPGCTFVMDAYYQVTKAMKEMNITNEELMILKILVLFFPEYLEEELEDMELLIECNKTYLSCLLHHLRKTLGPVLGGHRFSQFVDILQKLKEKAEIAKEAIRLSKGPLRRLMGTENDRPLMTEVFIKAHNE